MAKVEEFDVPEQAWAMVREALTDGEMTLRNGTRTKLERQDIVKLVQWAATLKRQKPKLLRLPEDFKAKKTTGDEDAS